MERSRRPRSVGPRGPDVLREQGLLELAAAYHQLAVRNGR
jgi:hypothetical protein